MSRVENGVVDAVKRDNKGLNIAGVWYSSYNGFTGISKGDVVSFEFTEKGQWKNIKGAIEKVTGVSSTASEGVGAANFASSENSQQLPDHYMIARGYMNKVQVFPVPLDHPDRAIIRQNSLTNAVNLLTHTGTSMDLALQDAAEEAIEVAQIFEKYSTGQLEMEAAVALVAGSTKTED